MATISLSMTIYNRQQYLRLAIDSILNQTYLDWELILWDNGSTDGATIVARQYANLDQRIRLIEHHSNIGHPAALSQTISLSDSKYLGWVDSDDILAPTALAETVAVLETDKNCGMVYTQHMNIDTEGKELGLGYRCLIPYHHNKLLTDFICHHFRLVRRSCYNLIGGIRPDCWYSEDYDLALKISEVTKIVQLHRPLYYYRLHADSLSGTLSEPLISAAATQVREALVRRGYDKIFKLIVDKKSGFRLERLAPK